MDPPVAESYPLTIWDSSLLRYHSVATCILFIYDITLTWAEEVEYVWPLKVFSPTKAVFLVQRYFGLCSHIYLAIELQLQSTRPCTLQWSLRFHIFRAISSMVMLLCIQTHFGLRAYALHGRTARIGWFLLSLNLIQVAGIPVKLTFATGVSLEGLGEGPLCMKYLANVDLLLASSGFPIYLLIIGSILQRFFLGQREGWGRVPYVLNVVRDDVALFCMISVCWIVGPYSVSDNVVLLYIIHGYFLSLCPMMCCRVILRSLKPRPNFAQPYSSLNHGGVSTAILFDIPDCPPND
ncbi:hypothetical protein CPB83DRAFT_110714 [Crepidotus variabilis]|uniref:DUF6533 domain-containing protein n=1 Tax=Crepidotus variabilis TaxID=179855 RepID=A0A9P6E4Y4_9AGAR|nr:hypothetical protein CPB83DRAFT_110714 [Crepidotus variabilis]